MDALEVMEVHVTTPKKIPENGSIWSKEEGTLLNDLSF